MSKMTNTFCVPLMNSRAVATVYHIQLPPTHRYLVTIRSAMCRQTMMKTSSVLTYRLRRMAERLQHCRLFLRFHRSWKRRLTWISLGGRRIRRCHMCLLWIYGLIWSNICPRVTYQALRSCGRNKKGLARMFRVSLIFP